MSTEVIVQQNETGLKAFHEERLLTVSEVGAQVARVHSILEENMIEGVHYGVIEGCERPSLYKPGAEKICMTFRLNPHEEVDEVERLPGNHSRFRVRVTLSSIFTGRVLGSVIRSASTAESKWAWRRAVCKEEFEATDPADRRVKWGKGKDGTAYSVDQVRTNPADLENTVLGMAAKRGLVAVTRLVTACSDIFDVDLEDEDALGDKEAQGEKKPKPKAEKKAPEPKLPNFGQSKGKAVTDPTVSLTDLAYYAGHYQKQLAENDPKKARFRDTDRELLGVIQAEIMRREALASPKQPAGQLETGLGSASGGAPSPSTTPQWYEDPLAWAGKCEEWEMQHPKAFVAAAAKLELAEPKALTTVDDRARFMRAFNAAKGEK